MFPEDIADPPTQQPRPSLLSDLTSLLNQHSRENGSNTPDFILANYMMKCLEAYEQATTRRDQWRGC